MDDFGQAQTCDPEVFESDADTRCHQDDAANGGQPSSSRWKSNVSGGWLPSLTFAWLVSPWPLKRANVANLPIDSTLASCDPFPSTSHWTGAAIIMQARRTKNCTVTGPRTSPRPMP